MPINYIESIKTEQTNAEKVTQSLKNLSSAIPADATALYLTGLQMVDNKSVTETGIVFGVGLILMLIIRVLTKAGIWVTLSTTLAYLIWTYAIGDGFFQAMGLDIGNLGAFAVFVYSAGAIAIANAKGK